jgi:hypothetical protein
VLFLTMSKESRRVVEVVRAKYVVAIINDDDSRGNGLAKVGLRGDGKSHLN